MRAQLIVAVDTAGFRTVAGPLVASAFVLPASLKEPQFVYLDRWGLRKKGFLLTTGVPDDTAPGIVRYFKSHSLSWANVRCPVEDVVRRGARNAELHAAGMALVRAMERLRLLHAAVVDEISLQQVMVCTSLKRAIPHDYLGQLRIRRNAARWYLEAARLMAEDAHSSAMRDVATVYPEYQFEQHRGFMTRDHRRLIRRLGLTPEHRGWHARTKASR